jgi:hypothetical protein
MAAEDIDIFEEGGAAPPPPMQLRFTPTPNFNQIIEFKRDPEAFNSYEAIESRYKEGRVDIERKKASGAYGIGDSFDREAFENDFRKLNQALDQGMPARLFPAFMPLTPQEADMTAEVYFYGDVPTMEEQIVTQTTYGDTATDRMIDARMPAASKIIAAQEGIGSLLGRFGS